MANATVSRGASAGSLDRLRAELEALSSTALEQRIKRLRNPGRRAVAEQIRARRAAGAVIGTSPQLAASGEAEPSGRWQETVPAAARQIGRFIGIGLTFAAVAVVALAIIRR